MKTYTCLFIGDVVGRAGRSACQFGIAETLAEGRIDLIVANVENASGGQGISRNAFAELKSFGVDVFTSGNHIWAKPDGRALLDEQEVLLRPANYPRENPGKGVWLGPELPNGTRPAVINLSGRVFMQGHFECPFKTMDSLLEQLGPKVRPVFVDFHAEATAEKLALGRYLDGRVAAVFGTHTHVQTADEQVLPKGTGFICDVGMSGPIDSVIGMRTEIALYRFISQMPKKYEAMREGAFSFRAVLVEVNLENGKCNKIRRLSFDFPGTEKK